MGKKKKPKLQNDHSRNSSGMSASITSTDTARFDHMLEAVKQSDDELIRSQKRTALFHRDLTAFMINTTIGVLLPAMKVMPWNKGLIAGSDEDISAYTTML